MKTNLPSTNPELLDAIDARFEEIMRDFTADSWTRREILMAMDDCLSLRWKAAGGVERGNHREGQSL